RFSDFLRPATDRVFDPLCDVRIFLQISLRVLAALADAHRVVAEPGARLFNEARLDAEIQDLTDLRHAFAVHDIELDLLEGRSDLVLDDLHPGRVADDLVAVLDLAGSADVETDR